MSFVMIGSLFFPMPAIQSSDGLNEGMNLTNYMNSFVGLVPVQVQLGGIMALGNVTCLMG